MNVKFLFWGPLAAVVAVGLTGYVVFRTCCAGSTEAPAKKILFYQDSMHPWIKSDQPGKCTICGMALTAIYSGQKGFGAHDEIVVLSSNSITALNVQTEDVKRQILHRTLRVEGTLEPNESRKTILSAPAAGRILSLAVESVGMEVAEKQKLLAFYSPDWALKRQNSFRFRVDIQPNAGTAPKPEADAFSVDLTAPQAGTVVERNAYNGQYVLEGEKLLTIIDSSVLWFRFDAYENQLPMLEAGQSIRVSVPAVPGRVFMAKIAVIEPVLNEATRTVKGRADIQNPQVQVNGQKKWLLHYGMYAEGQIQADQPEVLAVPRSAVLFPGDSAHVFVDSGKGAYERRRVKLGRQGDGIYEVLSGLSEGDQVVISGNVLIDAQAQFNLCGKPDRDNERDEAGTANLTNQEAKVEASASEFVVASAFDIKTNVSSQDKAAEAAGKSSREPLGRQGDMDRALKGYFVAAHALSQALAADAVSQFNQSALDISNSVVVLQKSCAPGLPLNLLVQGLTAANKLKPTENLEEARAQFLPFSSAVVEFAREVKKEDPAFSGLKIYYCPMAPKPGLWMQLQGPLQNPFFGSQMLKCGKEVQ